MSINLLLSRYLISEDEEIETKRKEIMEEKTMPKDASQTRENPYLNKISGIALPSLEELLNAGVHFGHKVSGWNPKFVDFVYKTKDGIHIIDIVQLYPLLKNAMLKIAEAADKTSILIVGTKGQAASLVEETAKEIGAFYVSRKWPAGLFTNFDVVKGSVSKLVKNEELLASGQTGLLKKEISKMSKDIEKGNILYSGVKFMDRLPGLIVVLDCKVEEKAVKEANKVGIPIIGIIDSNVDPSKITYPIPANDDSIRSLELIVSMLRKAAVGGKKSDSLKMSRNAYEGKLQSMQNQMNEEVKRRKEEEAESISRIKMMKMGVVEDEKKVVRVIRKGTKTSSTYTKSKKS